MMLLLLFGLLCYSVLGSSSCPGLPDPSPSSYCTSDPLLPTKIFHWTFNYSALEHTEDYLYNKAKSASSLNSRLCDPYLGYLNSNDTTEKQQLLKKLEDLASKLDAGYGAYFAEDPLISLNYGNVLVELEVPPNIKCLKFDFNNLSVDQVVDIQTYFKLGTEFVLSDSAILVYPWATTSLVVRDFSSLMPLKIRSTRFEIPKVLEMYKLPPILNDEEIVFDDWKKMYQYYGLWISSASGLVSLFSEDFKIEQAISKENLINYVISLAIDFEFLSNTPDIAAAKTQLNLTTVQFSIYTSSFNSSKWNLASNLDEKTTLELLIRANYLPVSARTANLIEVPALMLDHFTLKNGTHNLMKMIDALVSLRNHQIPRISTWKKYIANAIQ
jgi:hypothetical protein